MERITVMLVLTLLLVFPALGAPPLHSRETRGNIINERIHGPARTETPVQHAAADDVSSFIAGISPWRVLRRGATAGSTSSADPGNKNETHSHAVANFFHENKWMYGVVPGGAVFIIICILVFVFLCYCCWRNQKCSRSHGGQYHRVPVSLDGSTDMSTGSHQQIAEPGLRPKRPLEDNPEDNAVRFFLSNNRQYVFNDEKLDDLGSRVQKSWYAATMTQGEYLTERIIITVAPLSQSCPLQMYKHQKGLNKLLGAIKVHPFIHPILEVAYLGTHERVVIVQPKMPAGSLKDIIYKVEHPTLEWSQKYSNRSRGLAPEKVARYGRQILEAMEFLYHKGFPINALGHIQSGNIFVVDDVCKLGGYENMLLGYKTRIYRLCKDHLEYFDTILFGHLIFEMSAGYELKQLAPTRDEYKTVPKAIKPILEFIFNEELSHSISEIRDQPFFDVLLPETKDFNPADVQLTDSMRVVLEKVRKNKPRVQKHSQPLISGPGSWKDRFHIPKQIKQIFGPKKREEGEGMDVAKKDSVDVSDDDEPLLDLSAPKKDRLHVPKQIKQMFGAKKREEGEGMDVPKKGTVNVVDDDEPLLNVSIS